MGEVQFIKTAGEDLVVLARRDYDALLARAGDPLAEDIISTRILADTEAHTALAGEVMDRIIDGENPIAVLLEHRRLTQAELARLTGLTQPFISKLVRGEGRGSKETMEKLRIALQVSADVLEG